MPPLPPLVSSPRHWLLGTAYHARRAPLRFIPQWIREYGEVFRVGSPLGQATFVTTPELARQVLVERYSRYQGKSRGYGVVRLLMGNGLVTSEGEFWRGQRKLVQPAFHRRRLEALFVMMVERVGEAVGRLESAARTEPGAVVDLAPRLSQLTLDVLARAMFSSDVAGAAADVGQHIGTLNEQAQRFLRNPWLLLLPRRFPTPFTLRPYRAMQSLNAIVRGLIQARRQTAEAHDDLLQMLLSACAEGKGMSDEQLRDEVMTIFVAGHETTANAMAWLLYLVSQHPEVEERLVADIETHWPKDGLTHENIGEFGYVRQVIEESLRIHPTIWAIGRRCTEEDELGGYSIPAGMNMIVPIFQMHHDERSWPEPDRFDPGRFSPERRPSPEDMTYLPFGAGPRSCVGNHFALQELMIMTVLFHRRLKLRLAPGFRVEPDPLITLRPKHGLRMTLESRRTGVEPHRHVGSFP